MPCITPLEYGRRYADAVRAAGGSAMDAACAHIEGTFSEYGIIYGRKQTVRSLIRRGTEDTNTRLRYGRLAGWALDNGHGPDEVLSLLARAEAEAARKVGAQFARPLNFQHTVGIKDLQMLRLAVRVLRRFAPGMWHALMAELSAPAGYPVRSLAAAE